MLEAGLSQEWREPAEFSDPTPKLGAIPEYLRYERKVEALRASGATHGDLADLTPIHVVADDALRYHLETDRPIFLTDEEMAILNVLLRAEMPLTTKQSESCLPGIELRDHVSRLHSRYQIITPKPQNDAPEVRRFRQQNEALGRKKSILEDNNWRNAHHWKWTIRPYVAIDDKRTETSEVLPAPTAEAIRQQLRRDRYAILTDQTLGVGPDFREHLLHSYFNTEMVRVHEGDVPRNRARAREAVYAAFLPEDGLYITGQGAAPIRSGMYLARSPHTRVGERLQSNIDNQRPEYSRIESLQDPKLTQFIVALHGLVPPEDRPTTSTMGINFFRTHTDVVAKPHQDEENYVFVYVVDKVGYGARTSLYAKDSWGGFRSYPHASITLEPGMLIVFKDEAFQHMTSSIIPPKSGEARRDVIVCTANYASTHPW
jgi:hypothetical protein